ncbi:putative mitochondrial protein [Cucumis melo var. makuwa]|uniref:Putative mitochondrial protein n=1 Tax=Cucumis melo var. makuwa TaxID=1194695 RepID=A0A5D3BEZ6_CUCMM|nr:putative mitochondrial protein [Cucumis melo var. makuwa]
MIFLVFNPELRRISFVRCSKLPEKVLLRLDQVYNPVITIIQGKPEISWIDMQSELLIFEKRLEHQNFQKNTGNIIQNAAVCGKYGHSALVCYNRFNKEFLSPLVQDRAGKSSNFSGPSNPTALVIGQSVNQFATADTVIDPNWYIDSGATNHVTAEYSNLSNPSEYSRGTNLANSCVAVPKTVWHKRLGHPSSKVLNSVIKNCNFPVKDNFDVEFCDSCQLGKAHNLPFPKSQSHATAPFNLVYSDLWGPAPVCSTDSFRYYIMFVDDYSRAKSGIFKPKAWVHSSSFNWTLTEPTNFHDAIATSQWKPAKDVEYTTLLQNKTWSLVPSTSSSNIIGCKWVFRLKRNSDGPMVKASTINVVLSVALAQNWSLRQLDFNNAFLNGKLDEIVYMAQPPRYVNSSLPGYICKLNKAIYGLKQALRAWNAALSQALLKWGFVNSRSDSSLFIFRHQTSVILLLVYVDDVILTGNNNSLIQDFITSLDKQFALKDFGCPYFLGFQVNYLDSGFVLNQEKYITDLLLKLQLNDLKPTPSPSVVGKQLSALDGIPLTDPFIYRSTIGALQYLTHSAANHSSAAPPKFSPPTAASSRELQSRAAQPADRTLQSSPWRIGSRTPPSASRRLRRSEAAASHQPKPPVCKPSLSTAKAQPSKPRVSQIASQTPSIHPSLETRASFTLCSGSFAPILEHLGPIDLERWISAARAQALQPRPRDLAAWKAHFLAVRTRRANLQPIRIVPTWVSFEITTYLGLRGPTGRQSNMDIDMIRVIRRDPRSLIVLVLPPGSLQTKAEVGAKASWRATRSDRVEPLGISASTYSPF